MFCSECGSQSLANANFCSNCGVLLQRTSSGLLNTTCSFEEFKKNKEKERQSKFEPKEKKKKKLSRNLLKATRASKFVYSKFKYSKMDKRPRYRTAK